MTTSEWEPLYLAEKARADAAEAAVARLRFALHVGTTTLDALAERNAAVADERDEARAAVARVRALCDRARADHDPWRSDSPLIPEPAVRMTLDAP